MIIAADKNQFAGSHGISNSPKHTQMQQLGFEIRPTPLPFGDYCLVIEQMQETIKRRGSKLKKQDLVADIKLSIDSKKDLLEVTGNICNSKQHERFRDEAILAKKMGARFIVLVEEPNISNLEEVANWINPRQERYDKIKEMHGVGKWKSVPLPKSPPTKGETLVKQMNTMSVRYNIEWMFCRPEEAGAKIIELLIGENVHE